MRKWTQTERLGQEDEAPDTGDVADDQADGQDHPLGNAATQPAHKEEAGDHFHAAEAVHDAVLQLPVAKVLLGQRRHHGLREEGGINIAENSCWGVKMCYWQKKIKKSDLLKHTRILKCVCAPGATQNTVVEKSLKPPSAVY